MQRGRCIYLWLVFHRDGTECDGSVIVCVYDLFFTEAVQNATGPLYIFMTCFSQRRYRMRRGRCIYLWLVFHRGGTECDEALIVYVYGLFLTEAVQNVTRPLLYMFMACFWQRRYRMWRGPYCICFWLVFDRGGTECDGSVIVCVYGLFLTEAVQNVTRPLLYMFMTCFSQRRYRMRRGPYYMCLWLVFDRGGTECDEALIVYVYDLFFTEAVQNVTRPLLYVCMACFWQRRYRMRRGRYCMCLWLVFDRGGTECDGAVIVCVYDLFLTEAVQNATGPLLYVFMTCFWQRRYRMRRGRCWWR